MLVYEIERVSLDELFVLDTLMGRAWGIVLRVNIKYKIHDEENTTQKS